MNIPFIVPGPMCAHDLWNQAL